MPVVILHPCTKFEIRRPCVSVDMAYDVCQHPFDLETGMRVASKVGNLRSEFEHARPLGSPVIRYVCDGRTDGQNQCLLPPFLRAGHNK